MEYWCCSRRLFVWGGGSGGWWCSDVQGLAKVIFRDAFFDFGHRGCGTDYERPDSVLYRGYPLVASTLLRALFTLLRADRGPKRRICGSARCHWVRRRFSEAVA